MRCGHGFDRCAHVLPWTSQKGNPLPSESNPIRSVCCGIEPECAVVLGLREIWMQGMKSTAKREYLQSIGCVNVERCGRTVVGYAVIAS
jgi:hypothetical protein